MRRTAIVLVGALAASGCMGPYPLSPTDSGQKEGPLCDGLLQPGEGDAIDSPFDRDGDGFFDGNDAGCVRTYAADRLDCDDGNRDRNPDATEVRCNGVDDDCNLDTADAEDADDDGYSSCEEDCDDDRLRNPGEEEICWDEIDNDCDGEADPDCGPDYNGLFQITPPVAFNCLGQTVNIDMYELQLLWNPPDATAAPTAGGQPGTLNGVIDGSGYFVLEEAVVLGTAFSCDEYYRLTGQFEDADHFTAVFEAYYTGSACFGCAGTHTFPDLVGTRYP